LGSGGEKVTISIKQSAGLLLYRHKDDGVEILLGHPGGPFWRNKDLGSWSIPKGLIAEGETPLAAAKREFAEETGHRPRAKSLPLGEARQLGGKIVHVWAVEDDWEPTPSEQYVRDGMAATIRTAADLF